MQFETVPILIILLLNGIISVIDAAPQRFSQMESIPQQQQPAMNEPPTTPAASGESSASDESESAEPGWRSMASFEGY